MKQQRKNPQPFKPGHPCVLIAEIGINHNGSLALARRMIKAAADSGADAVKFQNYRTEDFITDKSLTYDYVSRGRKITERQYDLFKRCELSPGALRELARECRRRGVIFFSTPTSESGIRDALSAGAPWLKNGSDYLGHLPLIQAMARTRRPTLLSTGLATRAEIAQAVSAFRAAGGRKLVLLVCTSAYPTPPEEANLRRILAMQKAFRCPVGFSDHTEGFVAAVGAAALGACCVEKHFTLNKNLAGPDHRFSSDPAEFRQLVQAVRQVEKNLGSPSLKPAPTAAVSRKSFMLSCVAARDLQPGAVLRKKDIAFRRPGTGLPPKIVAKLIGRRVQKKKTAGHIFQSQDFY